MIPFYIIFLAGVLSSPVVSDDPNSAVKAQISVEATRQGVPVPLALAMAEVETGFRNVKAKRSGARGPLQVHKSALKPGELPKLLLDPEWNLRRGIEILKTYHEKSKGKHLLTRILFVCGYKYEKSCTDSTIQRIKDRWRPVARKYLL